MRLKLLISILIIAMVSSSALALPEMLDSFNVKYNTKGTRLDTCDLCHMPGKSQRSACNEVCHIPNKPQKVDPINLNLYGMDLRTRLNLPVDHAFVAIEKIDSARDGIPNIDKIHNLTFPGVKKDKKANLTDKKEDNKNLFSLLTDIINHLI